MLVLAAGDYVTDEGQAIQGFAAEKAPRSLLACGRQLIAERHYRAAMSILRVVIRDSRRTRIASRAQASLVDAEVGQIRGGRTSALPAPAVAGRTAGGESAIVIENSSPYTLELLLSGPGSRRFTVPRCAGCKRFSSSGEVSSCPTGPTRTFVVQPGRYSVVVQDLGRHIKPWAGTFSIDSGYRYDEGCFYIVTSLPLELPH